MIVDIHNHILPGLDDGPKDWGEVKLLAQQAIEAGISHVIATPHHKHQHKEHFYENSPSRIIDLVEEANRLFKENRMPISVYPGIEFHLHEGIDLDIEHKLHDFLTLNDTGKYILMEPPCSYYPCYTEDVLIRLLEKGFVPILAHPERNRVLRKHPEKIYNLVQMGVLVQVTAGSITGVHGRRLKNFSMHLLDHNLVHFVASDAHHFSRRKFELMNAYEYIKAHYSDDLCMYLKRNSIKALNGLDFSIETPQLIDKKIQYFFFYNHPLNQVR
ncbi:tyrosine protein phosphatase [Robertmurraya yapensis]|uniref:Tyrosine-protein phosphatase n=2 Tax=Bacillaceae TaxID=186817 RepID=A0A3S0IBS8_9BACI|nr:CpsB/CapC family capsule biosynthesis tyrosine phosphatase [Bacillus yapensis]RTR30000.1 tyrosine protein phosphatase [Bacillus yapensis]TKS95081.1 tyrosine protein phosphatase [Bacillus yapensis]